MGICASTPAAAAPPPSQSKAALSRGRSGAVFGDKYTQLGPLLDDLRRIGFENSELVVAVDFTGSNMQPSPAFEGLPLHAPPPPQLVGTACPYNPYEHVMTAVGSAIVSVLDRDHAVPCLGFGADAAGGSNRVRAKECFDMGTAGSVAEMLGVYRAALAQFSLSVPNSSRLIMAGPTSFAAVIERTIALTVATRRFHTLVIITDGQITDGGLTRDAIVKAADYPIAICIIGVGVGPWDEMEAMDGNLPERRVDNVQFKPFTEYMNRMGNAAAMNDFAVKMLGEIPQQYGWLTRHGLFEPRVEARLPRVGSAARIV